MSRLVRHAPPLLLVAFLAAAGLAPGPLTCVPVEPTDPADPITGRACAGDADCGAGYHCYTLAAGGYCLPGAPGGPTACREPEYPCPAGTVCSPIPWHAISGVCMAPCASAADCREGYRCGVVELFPGEPETPRSAEPVCWTVCELGMDQMCNDDPRISSLHGRCLRDGTCECLAGYPKNPETGRCR
jgi:hypothetical protein